MRLVEHMTSVPWARGAGRLLSVRCLLVREL